MNSEIPKVLHPICARPMICYVTDLVKALKATRAVAVLGYKHDEVKKVLPPWVKVALQKNISGTADAVKCALPYLLDFQGTILVLYGDAPLLTAETVKKLVKHHRENNFSASILTAEMIDPSGYGRMLRDTYSTVCGIAEDKDANDFQKKILEVNTGIVCLEKKELVRVLGEIKTNNRKKEYYLTDAIALLYRRTGLIGSIKIKDAREALGINSRVDLALANQLMQKKINESLMKEGVTLVDPQTTFISYGTKIGKDTVIYPFTVIEKDVTIGLRCSVGPFAHLREGTRLDDRVVVGNFLEIVRSRLSKNTWVKHFSYLGDSRIGANVNIGAGTVIANFDGTKKNVSVIKDNAFIGSDTVLVSPVTIGKGARTGAGSVVTGHTRVKNGTTVTGVPARLLKRKI